MPFLRIPEGTRSRTVFLQSTTLPLPSSPHWVPMTTTFLATVSVLAQVAHGPLAGAFDERAIAVGLSAFRGVPRKPDHDDLPGGSQLADRGGEPRVVRVRRTNGGRFRLVRRSAREIAQVHAESRCRPRASECLPNFVVTPAQRYRAGHAWRIGREHHPAVVVI